jgi:putative glycosyltransferase (TIGR04348 family)
LRSLGHSTRVIGDANEISPRDDLLIALHARKSAAAIEAWRATHADRPIVLVLTGTDLYEERTRSATVAASMAAATRIVVLQADAKRYLSKSIAAKTWVAKTRIIVQSATTPARPSLPIHSHFDVCVSGHLRSVKDPLRAAMASRLLPAESRIRILQIGACLDDSWMRRVQREHERNPRFRYLGSLPHHRALHRLARCRLLVVSSRSEGGPNVVSEAIACGVPILGSRISGIVGLLGPHYPGYFAFGDTRALASLLLKAETDAKFYQGLREQVLRLQRFVDPQTECTAWRELLTELT